MGYHVSLDHTLDNKFKSNYKSKRKKKNQFRALILANGYAMESNHSDLLIVKYHQQYDLSCGMKMIGNNYEYKPLLRTGTRYVSHYRIGFLFFVIKYGLRTSAWFQNPNQITVMCAIQDYDLLWISKKNNLSPFFIYFLT